VPRADFVISNNLHHVQMFRHLAVALHGRGEWVCRVISLCEFRGMGSPVSAFAAVGIPLVPVIPLRVRASSTMAHPAQARPRRLVQQFVWRAALAPRLRALLHPSPDVMVLPNDAAFPYDRLSQELRARRVPFVLVQEGVRFALPDSGGPAYGAGGAAAVAAWGEASAAYFRAVGVPADRIHLTGSPRYDDLPKRTSSAEAQAIAARWGLTDRILLFLTNPIDDQGFTNRRGKLELISRFLEAIAPVLRTEKLQVCIKPHARESAHDIRGAVAKTAAAHQVVVVDEPPLFSLLMLARAAIVMTSTAGLEAMLFGVPVGVLEIPGFGFAHDYVSSGAAEGLSWNEPFDPQVRRLLEDRPQRRIAVRQYLAGQLATIEGATDRVAALIERVAMAS
jgi:hypothetical protein